MTSPFGSSDGAAVAGLVRLAMPACLATLVLAAAILLVAATPAAAQQTCAPPARGDVPETRLAAMARGFNLVGWLDRADRRRPPPGLLEVLRARGFTHVRLPVDGALLMPEHARASAVADTLDEIDAALGHLLGLGFAVSLDLHPSAVFRDRHRVAPDAAFASLAAVWRQLAERYAKSSPERVFLELLNEPSVDLAVWRSQLEALVAMLRPIVPRHTFIVGTADYQQIYRLIESGPLADRNTVHAVHFYEPMSFSHQGADWSLADPVAQLAGVPFPLGAGDARVVRQIAALTLSGHLAAAGLLARDARAGWSPEKISDTMASLGAWSRRHDRAVVLNEFGVLKTKAGAGDRLAWLSAVRRAAEAQCIGWAHWELDESFGFVTRGRGGFQVDVGVVDALLAAGRR